MSVKKGEYSISYALICAILEARRRVSALHSDSPMYLIFPSFWSSTRVRIVSSMGQVLSGRCA
jgi:hypothetical protein